MTSINKTQNNESKYFPSNNVSKNQGVNSKGNDLLTNTYDKKIENESVKYDIDNLRCLSEENQNINNSNAPYTFKHRKSLQQTYINDRPSLNKVYSLKQNSNNNNFQHQFNNNFSNLNKNLNFKNICMNNVDYKISQIKSELAAINSDNLMMKEDIYKYSDMNKYIENEIKIQKEHNETLYNKNQDLIQENEALASQLEQEEEELNKLVQENENNHKILDENQIGLEMKNKKLDKDIEELIEINNKIKNDYELLNGNYEELSKKNKDINDEIEIIKEIQNKQFNNIEEKIGTIISEIEILKNEKYNLIKENKEKKSRFEAINKEKEDFYKKYQEQIMINETLNKKIIDNKNELNELTKKLGEKKIKKKPIRKKSNSLIKRKEIVKELHQKIKNYKFQSLKNSFDDDFSF